MSLKASNDFIQIIFNCYKDLVRFFRKRGAMKKVYETTREFEDALNSMPSGIAPPEDLMSSLRFSRRLGILTTRSVQNREIVLSPHCRLSSIT